ncbi:MAG: type I-E CRISPR-associated protein Cse2/CasB, partial [Nitrosomonas sp.]|nr:type I-E CRISPR-associated protein Cse2/CasB [Nitrosomonas sp.]
MNDHYFLITDDERKKLLVWHSWLNGDDGDRGGNRGDRARLRHVESAEDILLTDAFFRFLQQMPDGFPQKVSIDQRLPVAAAIAGLLAHVKTNDSRLSFAKQLATPPQNKSKAPMSELRFQQLQKSPTIEDFYRRMIRAIRL